MKIHRVIIRKGGGKGRALMVGPKGGGGIPLYYRGLRRIHPTNAPFHPLTRGRQVVEILGQTKAGYFHYLTPHQAEFRWEDVRVTVSGRVL